MLSLFYSIGQLRLSERGFHFQRKKAGLNFLAKDDAATEFTAYSQKPCTSMPMSALTGNLEFELRQFISSKSNAHKLRAIELVLPTSWGRQFLVTPLKNANSLSDYQGALHKRFVDLFGDDVKSWQVEMELSISGKSFACALPSTLLAMCVRVCEEAGIALLSVTTQMVAAINKLDSSNFRLGHGDWICCIEGESCHLLMRSAGGWHAVARFEARDVKNASYLESLFLRLALQHGSTVAERCVFIGEVDTDWQAWLKKQGDYWIFSVPSLNQDQQVAA